MLFGKHQMYFLMFFFWPLFHEAQLCSVYSLKWSYGQIVPSLLWIFAALSVLSFDVFVEALKNAQSVFSTVRGMLLTGL